MDNDFMSKLQSVLSNPEAMQKITSVASSLGAKPSSGEEREKTSSDYETGQSSALPTGLTSPFSGALRDPRIDLLRSIKPLLREEKRGRVDFLLNALTVTSLIKSFRK